MEKDEKEKEPRISETISHEEKKPFSGCEKLLLTSSIVFVVCVVISNFIPNLRDDLLSDIRSSDTTDSANSSSGRNAQENGHPQASESETQVMSFLATKEQEVDYISLYEQPCHPTGYREEKKLGSGPQQCGVAFLDTLLGGSQFGESTTTNRESYNLQWVNLHTIFRKAYQKGLFNDDDYQLIVNASVAAKSVVSLAFGIPEDKLYFTTVCQFTRYEQITTFSEFRHVDKVRSPELIVTSLLWLSTVDEDFGGGRLEFLNGPGEQKHNPIVIEPKRGRYAAWTSSYENPHGVHELLYGERFALIFAFTAKPDYGHSTIEDLRTWSSVEKPSFYY